MCFVLSLITLDTTAVSFKMQTFKIELASHASFSRAHVCGSARVLCISDPPDEISGLCLTLVREVEIKPDENQAGGKLKI